ncbi:MAG: hypothetical protein ACERJ1_09380 [Halodesulfovibrio sp.]|uniref:hypothetical protein n=1 Tax=Halodesulfovibrio sp. TaxID=1912772 RepID=UPI00359E4A86
MTITKTINVIRLLIVVFSLIGICDLTQSVFIGPLLPLGEKVELFSVGTYIKVGMGVVVFSYMLIMGTHMLLDKELNEVRAVKILLIAMCMLSVVCLFSRSIYSSQINEKGYVECKGEERWSIFYAEKFFAKDKSLCLN